MSNFPNNCFLGWRKGLQGCTLMSLKKN